MLSASFFRKIYSFAKYLPGRHPNAYGCKIRAAVLRRLARKFGSRTCVLPNAIIARPENLEVGDDTGIGAGSFISCTDRVCIGDRVLMGPEVMIFTSNHVWNAELKSYFKQGETTNPVIVEDDVWLGARCILLPSVTIGRGSTVAAGAVVTKSIPPFSVAAGVPAKVIMMLPTSPN